MAAARAALAALVATPPTATAVASARDRLLAARAAAPIRRRIWVDDLAFAELTGTVDRHLALGAVDAAAVARVVRWVVASAATVVTVRNPDLTPGVVRQRAKVPHRHRSRRR